MLAEAARVLAAAGVDEARLNAQRILMHVLGIDRADLYLDRSAALTAEQARRIAGLVTRRARREPLQHVLGETEFYGRGFACDGRALVPRPETEGLVDAVLCAVAAAEAVVVDLGVGSGCIAATLAAERPGWKVRGLDASGPALGLARENAVRLGVAGRVELRQGDFGRPPAEWAGADAVVSNPPYVRSGDLDGLEPEVRRHDPRAALDAGPDGLDAYRALAPAAATLLRPGGVLALEIGAGQADDVEALLHAAGFGAVRTLPDLAGIPRVLVAHLAGGTV